MQGFDFQREGLTGRIAMALAAVCLISFFYKMVKTRLFMYRLKKQGLVSEPILDTSISTNCLSEANASLGPHLRTFANYARSCQEVSQ